MDTNPIEDIQILRKLVSDVEAALHRQQEILRIREINLPKGTFTTLSEINADLESIESQLVNETTELSQLSALAGTLAQINSSLDLGEVLGESMQNVVDLTGAERGYIILTNPFSDEWEFHIAYDQGQQEKEGTVTFQGSRSILRKVLESGKPLLTDNAYDDERFSDNNQTIARLALRSVLCVPLKLKDKAIGAVYVDNRVRAGVFTKREENLLIAFANQAAIAIENARLFARVQNNLNAIIELKEFMDRVFDSIGSGVITTDNQDLITIYNRAAAEILMADTANVIGQPLSDLLPQAELDRRDPLQLLELEMEAEQRRKMLSIKFSPLRHSADRTQDGMAVVIDDITQQREGEETLKTLRRYLPPEMVDNIQTIAMLDLGGERREVTCLFAEVRPLHTFPHDLSASQIMDLLNRFLTVATDCIHNASGVIDKYMGNEVMGLFNSQLSPCQDHATQAVQAALDMRAAFVQLYAELGIQPNPHFYRVGIHTGVATLGNVGSLNRRDFTAIGDTINLAKRLEENALSGQMIISEDTLRHMRQHGQPEMVESVICNECDPIQVKGRQQRTRIYEVFQS
ncbi:MAG: GAF domain-containing protein [Anaerolineae bacterium]|nr:GAF domain-containing protein [Anaerolineae bacterium]